MRLSKIVNTVVGSRLRWKFQPHLKPQIACQAREELTQLGPTFVKIGQYISTRGDLFPTELVTEFSKLQDTVESFEWDHTQYPYLTNISPMPIAAASLGQVHTCTYKGTDCVVKVLRPNIHAQVENDIQNLFILTKIIELLNPSGSRDIVIFVRELDQMLKLETNYLTEAKNTRNFRKNFKDVDWVIVPEVLYATENILVMEYVPSVKITEVHGYDKKSLAWALTKAQLMQVFNTGFFHGDPHPGNVGVYGGKIVYYDFGMISEISPQQKKTLLALLVAITNENEDQILAIANSMGIISSDPTGLRTFVRFFLEYIKKNKFENVKELVAFKNNPLKLNGSFFYLVRSFGLIEGISKQLDPTYSSSEVLQRYVEENNVMEDAMLMSVQSTYNDITGFSYRLSNIEKRVKRYHKDDFQRNLLFLLLLCIILIENDWIIRLLGE